MLLDAIEDLRAGRIDPEALARAKKALRLEWARSRADRDEIGSDLGRFAVLDRWETLPAFMEARETASASQIQQAAQRYFVPINRVIATSRRNPVAVPAAMRATSKATKPSTSASR